MTRRKIAWTGLLALLLSPVISSTSASAQTANATPDQGGGSSPFQTCAWYLTISNPGPWAWIQISLEGHRVFGYGYQDGYESQLYASVTINGTYLPSQTLTCAINNAGVQPGWVEYTEGTSYTINHSNPQCDGYPTLDFGYHPGVRVYIDESLGTPNNSEVLGGVENGQYYWGDVGSELNYTTLNTTNGPDDAFIAMSTSLPPDTPGSFNPDTRYVRLNQAYSSPSTFWALVTAHELGHAVGFNHASGSSSSTVLNAVYQFSSGLQPRVLDKCGAVRAFPIDIR